MRRQASRDLCSNNWELGKMGQPAFALARAGMSASRGIETL